MRLIQGNFNAGIIGPAMYSRGDLGKFQTGVKDAVNMVVRPEGGIFNRGGTHVATGFDVSTPDGKPTMIPFDLGDGANFMLEFADNVMRVLFERAYVLNSTVGARPVTAVTAANPARFTMATAPDAAAFTVGRLAYFVDPNGTSVFHQQVVRISAIAGSNVTFEIVGGVTVDTTTGDWGAVGASALLYEVYELASPYAIEDTPDIAHAQDLETVYLAHAGYAPRTLKITAADNWAFALFGAAPTIAAPGSPTAVATTGTGTVTYRYKASALSAETREESLPSAEATCTNDLDAVAGNINTFSWAAVPGASAYKVYKDYNGIFGYIGITEGLTFVDENITPDTLDNPQSGRDPFAGADNYPSFVTFIEQRLTFAASNNQPQAVEMSTAVAPANFNRALTPGDSDAISFRARAQKQNKIVAIVPADDPVIFTRGAEGYVRGGDDQGYLTPTNLILKTTTYRGSRDYPKPLLVGEAIMHVQRDGSTIREYVPQRTDQESADLTLLARHLFRRRTITSWAYAQAPDSVVWVTTDRGELYSLTYAAEHEVWAWTRHEVAGTDVFVHQVEVLPEGGDDIVYLVVSRTLYGQEVTWIETIDPRNYDDVTGAYFVDAGLTYAGAATQIVRGWLHLRGEPVSVLADGSVVEGAVISAQGRVDLGADTEIAHVGLGYSSYLTTLGVDFSSPSDGSTVGKLKSASTVVLQVEDTRGIAVGREGGRLNEVKQFEGDGPIQLETATYRVTIEGDWRADARITVRQNFPLPMTVTAIAPDWEVSDT
jgi:hypothetical protein